MSGLYYRRAMTAAWKPTAGERPTSTYHLAGRAFNEFLCDGWLRLESQRLEHIRSNAKLQRRVRRCDAEYAGEGSERPGHVFLPSSFPGSFRFTQQRTEDALALAAKFGKPTFFR